MVTFSAGVERIAYVVTVFGKLPGAMPPQQQPIRPAVIGYFYTCILEYDVPSISFLCTIIANTLAAIYFVLIRSSVVTG